MRKCLPRPYQGRAQAPVYEITPVESTIKFDVESSVAITARFSKWDASLTFKSSGSFPQAFWKSRSRRIVWILEAE